MADIHPSSTSPSASAAQTPSFDIFLSHAGEDKETIARPLYQRFHNHGISVFFDVESFRLGDDCPKVMNDAMQTAPVGVFIMSPEFVAKEWPMRELLSFVDRYDRARAADKDPPLLIPVFYRLSTRDCRDPALFDTYSELFLKHRLFKRAMDGSVSIQEFSHALDTAATVWSIENRHGASNDDDPSMSFTRKSFIQDIQNRILDRLQEKRPDLINRGHPVMDAQPQHENGYTPSFTVPSNPPRLTLDYASLNTCEGRLRAAVLRKSESRIVAVVASGKGGVGKTCALRGLAEDVQIKKAFPGGILYIQLGNDADTSDLVKGIAKIVDRTGGSELRREIEASESVGGACEKASKWFDSHKCLFLIDDIWKVNSIDSKVLTSLGLMVNRGSKMVHTTRDKHFLRRANEVIAFNEKETLGDLSRRMLLNHAGLKEDIVLDDKNEVALKYFLTLCQGLPLGFGIVGGSVWEYSSDCSDKQDALSEFYRYISSNQKYMMDAEADEYGKLPRIVGLSLQVLEKRDVGKKFEHKFRALCVLEKQQSVPGQMLQKLWDLDSLQETISIVESLANVSVVEMTRKDGLVFVKLHDLILDIAAWKAAEENETHSFFQRLVGNYISCNRKSKADDGMTSVRRNADMSGQLGNVVNDTGAHKRSQIQTLNQMQTKRFRSDESASAKFGMEIEQGQVRVQRNTSEERMAHTLESQLETERGIEEVVPDAIEPATASSTLCHAWWNVEDDGYIYNNVCRILRRAGYVDELLRLLSQPQWIVKRLVEGGIFCVEQDLAHGKAMIDENASQYGDRKEYLEMIGRAARLSAWYVNHNPREVWFQLHGRLLWHATQRELTSEFVKRMEMCAPKPWLKASLGLLQQAGGGALEVVNGPGEVVCTRVEGDEIWILWAASDGYDMQVGRYNRMYNRYEHEELVHRETGRWIGGVKIASFLPDQRSLVTAHDEGFYVWNRQSGASEHMVLHECEDHRRYIQFCADGTRVACEMWDHSVRMWDTLSGKPVGQPLQGHTDQVNCVAMSADGTRIVSGSSGATVRVWDARSGNAVGRPLQGHTGSVTCVAVSADCTWIVSGSGDATVRMWDARSGSAVGQPLQGHTSFVKCVAVSLDGTRIVSGSGDATLRVWDARSCKAVGQPLQGHTGLVECVALSLDGTWIVSGSNDETVRVWDARSGNSVKQAHQSHTEEVNCVAVSADGTRIVSGSGDATLRVWDARSGNAVGQPLQGHTDEVNCVAVSTDGNLIVSGSRDATVRMWDARSGSAVGQPLQGHVGSVMCVAVSLDGTRIVSGSDVAIVRVWDARSGKPVGLPLHGHTNVVSCVAVSWDGTRIVSGSYDATVRVWDARSCKAVGQPLQGHTGWVMCVAVSLDGARIVSGSHDRTVRVWDTPSGNDVRRPLQDHIDWVKRVAISADGTCVVSDDGYVLRLWAVNTHRGKLVLTSRHSAWERTIDLLALTWSSRSDWTPQSTEVIDGAEDGSQIVLGTCDAPVCNFNDGDVYFDGYFRSCRVVR